MNSMVGWWDWSDGVAVVHRARIAKDRRQLRAVDPGLGPLAVARRLDQRVHPAPPTAALWEPGRLSDVIARPGAHSEAMEADRRHRLFALEEHYGAYRYRHRVVATAWMTGLWAFEDAITARDPDAVEQLVAIALGANIDPVGWPLGALIGFDPAPGELSVELRLTRHDGAGDLVEEILARTAEVVLAVDEHHLVQRVVVETPTASLTVGRAAVGQAQGSVA